VLPHLAVWLPSVSRLSPGRSGLAVVQGGDLCQFGAARCEVLSRQLPAAIASLWRRRACEVPEGILDDFVTLGWMNWNSRTLVLTLAGQAVHDGVVARGTTP
jgi:hypothetical protein